MYVYVFHLKNEPPVAVPGVLEGVSELLGAKMIRFIIIKTIIQCTNTLQQYIV